jgi:D-alanyl-D-alanine dipeptidase
MQAPQLRISLHYRIALSRATGAIVLQADLERDVLRAPLRRRRMGAVRLATSGALLALLAACATTTPRYPVPALPVSRLEQLRTEALRATPPLEEGEFRESELVELIALDQALKLEVRYAGSDNFLRAPIYPEARVFLQRPAAEAVVRANRSLQAQGYGLMLFDGYRPWYVTKLFWEATPQDKRNFVTDPAIGSRHNRGCAIDLSLYDLKTGLEVSMPSGYDEFSERAHPNYMGGTPEQRAARELLRRTMEAEGFTVNDDEWWHFDYRDWQSYRIGTVLFKDLPRAR